MSSIDGQPRLTWDDYKPWGIVQSPSVSAYHDPDFCGVKSQDPSETLARIQSENRQSQERLRLERLGAEVMDLAA